MSVLIYIKAGLKPGFYCNFRLKHLIFHKFGNDINHYVDL